MSFWATHCHHCYYPFALAEKEVGFLPPRREDYPSVEAYMESLHQWAAISRDARPTRVELQALEGVLIEYLNLKLQQPEERP